MELRKKSILISLVIGDGSITQQRKKVKNKVYTYANFEVIHSYKQKEYIEWKANLCRSITGNRCNVREKIVKERVINGKITPELLAYRFTCSNNYFRVLRKWLYPQGKKVLSKKYISYLDEQGIAIWYMDDGSTYIPKQGKTCFSCEISTHIPEKDALELIELFKEKWNISFFLHKKAENQFNIRCYTKEAYKFIQLIKPFVPQCMEYKVRIPEYYNQECSAS
jgi:hypothetical protein